jgi:hypothetical protein
MSYTTVHFQEEHLGRLDTSIMILYDEYEENFYLYGTRNTRKNREYTSYAYRYHYTELDAMVYFIKLVMISKNSRITIEYNNVFIPEKDIDYVDYDYLKRKINRDNEIVAFENCKLKAKRLKKTLSYLFLREQVCSDAYCECCGTVCSA